MDINNLPKLPRSVLRMCFILINNLYCIPTYVIWMLLLWPLGRVHPHLYWKIEGYLFHWLLAMVASWCDSAGYTVTESGDDISKCINERTLIIANHQSTADVPILFSCYNIRKQVLPNITWIMDSLFKYTNFGVVSYFHQDFFIKSGKENRDRALEELSHHLIDKYIPLDRKWLVLFPEGGFLRKRKAISHKYADKHNLPKFENVSLPRVGALKVIMKTISPQSCVNNNSSSKSELQRAHIKYVLDITIAYPKGVPIDLSHIVFGTRPPCETVLFYRVYRATEVPEDSEAMTQWLFQRWEEKEKMLQSFYDTGVISTEYSRTKTFEPRPVIQDYLRILILNIFFIMSSYVHVRMFIAAYHCCVYFLVY
ncbi:acyl-CoA:lysophosphatidylglycerol acyltransferase 1-like isoform X2 [Euwallacea fornicatus]